MADIGFHPPDHLKYWFSSPLKYWDETRRSQGPPDSPKSATAAVTPLLASRDCILSASSRRESPKLFPELPAPLPQDYFQLACSDYKRSAITNITPPPLHQPTLAHPGRTAIPGAASFNISVPPSPAPPQRLACLGSTAPPPLVT